MRGTFHDTPVFSDGLDASRLWDYLLSRVQRATGLPEASNVVQLLDDGYHSERRTWVDDLDQAHGSEGALDDR